MNTSDPETSAIADTRLSAIIEADDIRIAAARKECGLAARFLTAVLAVCAAIFTALAFRDGQPLAIKYAIAALAAAVGAGMLAVAARRRETAEKHLATGLSACVIVLAAVAPQAAIIDMFSQGVLWIVIPAAALGIGAYTLHQVGKLGRTPLVVDEPSHSFATARAGAKFDATIPPAKVFVAPRRKRVRSYEAETALLAVVFSIFAFFFSMMFPPSMFLTPDPPDPWVDGKTGAGIIRQALDVYRAKNGGKLPGITIGPALDHADKLRLTREDFDYLTYFNADDFRIAAIDTEAGTYTLSVTGTHPDSPSGTYTLDSDGNETGP